MGCEYCGHISVESGICESCRLGEASEGVAEWMEAWLEDDEEDDEKTSDSGEDDDDLPF